jgi:hypothetical protein
MPQRNAIPATLHVWTAISREIILLYCCICVEWSSGTFIFILAIKYIVYKSHVTRCIVSYWIESRGAGDLRDKISVLETIHNSPDLRSCPNQTTFYTKEVEPTSDSYFINKSPYQRGKDE